ncbi:glycosyltransferase [Methylobacterium oxalidis]|uniref:Glycosyltransferase 2-like domain-containing protein n=1 Tax=Methylobacterium oxalidis TaxID=944322 RepID=A0A512J360_9HYPH|nr:glycosyltransferase [Methylobacterium oxalidis]GEP04392.1 hypothetical protein MOX02_24300 [Methylobacterium oxalidis]GJE34067.1 hypothetical protein LDDCCGHA_4271 [Methylobacterium oxalidis]GLS62764.1 hypothetical protein GCM10007888_11450 [Methylobacterium oxalidis]
MIERDIWISVDGRVPPALLTRQGAALGLRGFVHHPSTRIAALQLRLIQGGHSVEARQVILEDGLLGPTEAGIDDAFDGGFYVSAVFPPCEALRDGQAWIDATVTWDRGTASCLRLASVDLIRVDPITESDSAAAAGPARIGIAMATFNPDLALFARQIGSIRAQTHPDWICVISDDGSQPEILRAIAASIEDEPRFRLLPSGRNLGFYRNFERACAALPPSCAFVALSDQDDVWLPERLARQIATAEAVPYCCCYSDMAIVQPQGAVVSPTYWVHREARWGSLGGLLLANVVTGMTVLARRELIDEALPFPATPGLTYHDHWIALVAGRRGSLRYVAEPLVRYVQHGGNHTGALVRWPDSQDVLRQTLRRIGHFAKIGVIGGRLRRAAAEPSTLDWLDIEPARLRILVERLTILPGGKPARDRALRRLSRRFGPVRLLTCGANWRDRYRRGVAIELGLGGLLKRALVRLLNMGHVRAEAPAVERRPA